MEEETYTPPEAARILRLSRRRVTQMLAASELEETQNPETGRRAIPKRAIHERLKDGPARGRADNNRQRPSEAPQVAAELIEARRSWWSKLFGGRSR